MKFTVVILLVDFFQSVEGQKLPVAFVHSKKPSPTGSHQTSRNGQKGDQEYGYHDFDLLLSRRQWFLAGSAAAASSLTLIPPAIASERVLVSTTATCDQTVSVWKEPGRKRLLYILGTAHISKLSAQLAGQLVQDVHPDAVFLELDLKRVGGIRQPSSIEASSQSPSVAIELPSGYSATTINTENVGESVEVDRSAPRKPGFVEGLQQRALSFGAATLGNAIRGMYKNLGDAGFQPGEEFLAAATEARKINAAVVLGDQDVDITLRRLTQALAATDLSQLNDDTLGRKMQELMPGASNKDMIGDPGELAAFVEKLKSRENVRQIMGELRQVAPALVQVMLTERDAYMALGIDTLNQFECIVAVVGLAHMDGIEANLKRKSWQMAHPKCRNV